MRTLLGMTLMCTAAMAAPFEQAERLFGPADVNAIAGHGGLTIGVNRSGRITTCRWPSPGYFEHVQYTTSSRTEPLLGVSPSDGAGWAMQIGDQLLWMYDDRWLHTFTPETAAGRIEINSELINTDVTVRQQFVVAEEEDSFVARIVVRGTGGVAPTVYWYANFSPSTRLIPNLPLKLWAKNDFAAFRDSSGAMCHFRPGDPSTYAWAAARDLASREASRDEWNLDNGVYLVQGTAREPNAWAIGSENGNSSVITQIQAGTLSRVNAATGQVASAIQVPMTEDGDVFSGAVFVGFGEDVHTAFARFERTIGAGTGEDSTDAPPHDDLHWIKEHARSTIKSCTDRATGSVVRSPMAQPPMALDWPTHGVWAALSNDMAGDPAAARRLIEFYLEQVREPEVSDYMVGPIPSALYTNGTEAAPDTIIDAAAAGRLLWIVQRHGASYEEPDRDDFYRRHWEAIETLADFLVLWRAPGERGPLYTFDYDALRDRRTPELFAASYLGLRAASRIANALDESRPEWDQAKTELDTAMRQFAADTEDSPETFWDTEYFHERIAELDPRYVEEALRPALGGWDTRVLERLAKTCLAHELLAPDIRTNLTTRVRAHLESESPDSADAAFAYIIAHRLTEMEETAREPIPITLPDTP